MTRLQGALVIAVVCLTGAWQDGKSAAQAADEMVQKNIQAKGGLQKLKAITTIKQTGTLTLQGGIETPIVLWNKRPNLQRQEMTVGGKPVVNGFDGVSPWISNPMLGTAGPILVTGPQADTIREQANFDGLLVDYKRQGTTIVLVPGDDMLDGRKLIHLKLTSRLQNVTHLYLDAETFLEAKMTTETPRLMLEQQFFDYSDVQGIKWPFRIRTLANGTEQSQMKLDKVEFDTPMELSLFKAKSS